MPPGIRRRQRLPTSRGTGSTRPSTSRLAAYTVGREIPPGSGLTTNLQRHVAQRDHDLHSVHNAHGAPNRSEEVRGGRKTASRGRPSERRALRAEEVEPRLVATQTAMVTTVGTIQQTTSRRPNTIGRQLDGGQARLLPPWLVIRPLPEQSSGSLTDAGPNHVINHDPPMRSSCPGGCAFSPVPKTHACIIHAAAHRLLLSAATRAACFARSLQHTTLSTRVSLCCLGPREASSRERERTVVQTTRGAMGSVQDLCA